MVTLTSRKAQPGAPTGPAGRPAPTPNSHHPAQHPATFRLLPQHDALLGGILFATEDDPGVAPFHNYSLLLLFVFVCKLILHLFRQKFPLNVSLCGHKCL